MTNEHMPMESRELLELQCEVFEQHFSEASTELGRLNTQGATQEEIQATVKQMGTALQERGKRMRQIREIDDARGYDMGAIAIGANIYLPDSWWG